MVGRGSRFHKLRYVLMKVLGNIRHGENQLMDVEHENGKFIEGKCSVLPCGFHFNSRHLATLGLMDFLLFPRFYLLIFLVLSLDLHSQVLSCCK